MSHYYFVITAIVLKVRGTHFRSPRECQNLESVSLELILKRHYLSWVNVLIVWVVSPSALWSALKCS